MSWAQGPMTADSGGGRLRLIALLLTTRDWVTIPVYMASLSSSMTGQLYGAKAALGLIAAVPPVIMGIAIQKQLVRGLTFGALKE